MLVYKISCFVLCLSNVRPKLPNRHGNIANLPWFQLGYNVMSQLRHALKLDVDCGHYETFSCFTSPFHDTYISLVCSHNVWTFYPVLEMLEMNIILTKPTYQAVQFLKKSTFVALCCMLCNLSKNMQILTKICCEWTLKILQNIVMQHIVISRFSCWVFKHQPV